MKIKLYFAFVSKLFKQILSAEETEKKEYFPNFLKSSQVFQYN